MIKEYSSRFKAHMQHDPMATVGSPYATQMFEAIATGILLGTKTLTFISQDKGMKGAPTIKSFGELNIVNIDADKFSEAMYVQIRAATKPFGATLHASWPPPEDNSGYKLRILADSIAYAIKTQFQQCSTDTIHQLYQVNSSEIKKGKFSGLVPNIIIGSILGASPLLKGAFWPVMVPLIVVSYIDQIHNEATATINVTNEVCAPSASQVCGIGADEATGTKNPTPPDFKFAQE